MPGRRKKRRTLSKKETSDIHRTAFDYYLHEPRDDSLLRGLPRGTILAWVGQAVGLTNRKEIKRGNASVATDLDGRCALNIGDELLETEHVAQGWRAMGRASWIFPQPCSESFVS